MRVPEVVPDGPLGPPRRRLQGQRPLQVIESAEQRLHSFSKVQSNPGAGTPRTIVDERQATLRCGFCGCIMASRLVAGRVCLRSPAGHQLAEAADVTSVAQGGVDGGTDGGESGGVGGGAEGASRTWQEKVSLCSPCAHPWQRVLRRGSTSPPEEIVEPHSRRPTKPYARAFRGHSEHHSCPPVHAQRPPRYTPFTPPRPARLSGREPDGRFWRLCNLAGHVL